MCTGKNKEASIVMPDMVTIGECMIELFSDKPIEFSATFERSLAGDTFNILVAAGRLGTTTGYITRLGDDPFKEYLTTAFTSENIDISQIKTVPGFNAAHFVSVNADGDRDFVYYRANSAPTTINPDDLDPDYIASSKILHCSGIAQAISNSSRETVLEAAKIAKANGVTVSYDPNFRYQLWSPHEARLAMEEIMPYTDIFLPSTPADSEVLFGTQDEKIVLEQAQSMGVQTSVITMGEKGAFVSSQEDTFYIKPHNTKNIIDTTGAGDSFKGGVIHSLLSGKSIRESAEIGNIMAGLNIQGRGALGAMPTGQEVYQIYQSQNSK